ncbi:transposase, IS4 family protein [Caballeronia terrestris]|uniref:Transposase, IS4 family protein n=1 Tax=Caballeronia terrestris TaxID=1226301 RepID=A0A158KPS5_9BURK|nr:transposase, IS4 family protein [Caballeronia terrestris]
MHQTRKGKQWYFGMKLHIGVDSQSRSTHSAVLALANVHDKHPLTQLLEGRSRLHQSTNQRTRRAGEID